MNIARILYPVEVLGPGKRIGIWVCGCNRRCKGCSNPELWDQKPEYEVTHDEVMDLIKRIAMMHSVEGFTISGGEPMDQARELAKLIPRLKAYSNDILIYSGYRIEELRARKNEETDMVLEQVTVLIDGEYREAENTDVLLRGYENQRIHILNSDLKEKYVAYLAAAHNQIQNFTTSNGVVSVGIHKRGFGGSGS